MRWFITLSWWDKFSRSLLLAVRSLWLHKLRAFLSVLGIIIGTGAVIVLMAFGEGSMQDALEDIQRQGATNIIIRSEKPTDDSASSKKAFIASYGLTDADYQQFKMISTVEWDVPMRIFVGQEIRHLDRFVPNGRVVGTTGKYSLVNRFGMATGRFLVDDDDFNMANVAVIGSTLAATLFPFENPVGQSVVIGNKFEYRVVGVISDRLPTGSGTGKVAEEFNNDVYIPLATCQLRFGEKVISRTSGSRSGEMVELHQITLKIAKMEQVRASGEDVRDILSRNHMRTDWSVTIPLDRLEEAERARDRGTLLLAAIAGISLIVGGIGIMNIMLATVTERTREIGIRRALGAKRRDIVMQFLIEAVVQTSLGGLVGMSIGLLIVFGVPLLIAIPVKLHVPSLFLALAASIITGVLFGVYPAIRAARLDPIEALRHV